ncbi:peroxiredoxin-like family protein [Flavobacterium cellulosilyticum]|uniref:thioredoxin-dependent peroxiredoxin n=1 Tax=Flavobacterium cellulosilyticum TaxID=2541731 RepID=A0A4R5C9W1_9FLAO|nr:peroxiredoxin-like family protein [Flavobacterium cellulosilyticum]TDD95559.1 AhpC/TSA family protein [Flavobacterium cellulosilyticum]
MKNAFLTLSLLIFSIVTSAQSELPKTANDVSPLLIGEKIPNLTLKSIEGNDINLSDTFSKQKTILVFYRGGWCPYCNLQLGALGESEKELLELGYQIIAVSPDSPKNLKVTDEKDAINYMLLSDSKGELTKAVGIAFQAPTNYESMLSKSSDGLNKSFLPVPTVFILNENGEIQFEHITPDYKHRITTELLIAAAKSLQ